MTLHSYRQAEIDSSCLLASLSKFGGILIQNAIPSRIAQNAHDRMETFFSDPELLMSMPYDAATRLGYTAPGVETLQGRGSPNTCRHTFNYRPTHRIHEPLIASLFDCAVDAGMHILSLIDRVSKTAIAKSAHGDHFMTLAQYLIARSTSEDILFDSHRDFSLLTVFIGTGSSGLEVMVKGTWEAVEMNYGDVLIGVGTPLVQYHPSLKTLQHRVVGGDGQRVSAFLFIELDAEIRLPSGEPYRHFISRITSDTRV